jgi:ornithine decarboxylase
MTSETNVHIPELLSFLKDYNVKLFNNDDDILDIIKTFLDNNNSNSAFHIVDLGAVIKQYERWQSLLPTVRAFYAQKSNPNDAIITLLNKLGAGFDCASKGEIAQALNLGVDPSNIIFANPCKESSHLQYARAEDVDLLTFDSENELDKIKLYHPKAELLVRIKVDDSKSVCKFSCKFGVDINDDELRNIYSLAKASRLKLVGVSFHVGSNCKDVQTFYDAIKDARKAFDLAKEYGFNFNILDIGGGFPGVDTTDGISFEKIAEQINLSLHDNFNEKDFPNLRVIAEPGRYFVSASHTLVLNVIGKKIKLDKQTGKETFVYTLNDGVYGSFNCIYFDHASPIIQPYNERNGETHSSVVFGGTCDSLDTISNDCQLPELCVGEWVYVENFGAYTVSSSTTFNGFPKTPSYYIIKY